MATNATTEQRVKDLETEIQYLRAEFRQLANARTGGSHDQIIRPAKTVVDSADDTYPSTGHVAPIVFQDAVHEGQETDVTLTDRSADNQGFAGSLSGVLPPVGTEGVAFRYNRQWFLLSQSDSAAIIKSSTPIDGIDGTTPGEGTATRYVISAGELTSTGQTITVWNVGGELPADTYAIAWLDSLGSWIIQPTGSEGGIVCFKIVTGFQPGGSGTGRRQAWSGSAWANDSDYPDNLDIGDAARQVLAFPNDLILARWSAIAERYETIAPHGLIQIATPNAAVASGDVASCTVVDSSPAVVVDARNKTGRRIASGDKTTIVWIPHRGSAHANGYQLGEWWLMASLSVVVPVELEFNSGDAGDHDTQCSYSYNVLDYNNGATLASAQNITSGTHRWKRPAIGAMVAATYGLAWYDASANSYSVFWCNESIDPEACE